MMVFVNSRTYRASEDETPRCEVVTLQTGTLQFGPAEIRTTNTEEEQCEQHVKNSFIHGEIHDVEA
jgi:hypothetical protein